MMRQLVLASLIGYTSSRLNFTLIFFHYSFRTSYSVFLLFISSLILNLHLYFQFPKRSPILIHINRYYRAKLLTSILWLLEWPSFLFIAWLLSSDLSSYILESVLTLIGVLFEIYFLCTLKIIYKLAATGEPMQPALTGIELKLETTLRVEPVLNQTFIQSTEINEVRSLPTKDFLIEQTIHKNEEVRVVDFTSRSSPFVVVNLDCDQE